MMRKCQWKGCTRMPPPNAYMCGAHWYRLPAALRNLIWHTYRPGQEVTMTPSDAYVRAAAKVQAWIAEHEKAKES